MKEMEYAPTHSVLDSAQVEEEGLLNKCVYHLYVDAVPLNQMIHTALQPNVIGQVKQTTLGSVLERDVAKGVNAIVPTKS